MYLQNVMPGVEWQLSVEHGASHSEALQEKAQSEARVDAVHEKQALLAQQAQFQERHRHQQPVVPAAHTVRDVRDSLYNLNISQCRMKFGTKWCLMLARDNIVSDTCASRAVAT